MTTATQNQMTRTATQDNGQAARNKKPTILEKFRHARNALNMAFVEREEAIDCLLVGLVARENVLLVGEPGVAKSAVEDGLAGWLDGPTFSILMHRSVGIEEIMGNMSLRELTENDVWRRNTVGRMPNAVVAVTDEIN